MCKIILLFECKTSKNTLKNVKSEINSNDIVYVYEKSFERDKEIVKMS